MTRVQSIGLLIGLSVLLTACSRDPHLSPEPMIALDELPVDFPEIDYPSDNVYTEIRAELGRHLFYDTRLSRDQTISCASCHHTEYAFAHNVQVSPGVEGRLGTRNAPSLANVAYHPYYMREGGVPTLEMQVLVPIQEHSEMDFNILLVEQRLATDTFYQRLSREAYSRDLNYYVITRALANFQRTLISGHSEYDRWKMRDPKVQLTGNELEGMSLFFSDRTNCSSCHSGFDFSDYSFRNNGLYLNYTDPGRFRLTGDSTDWALFKVPSLRNVGLTAPYMHDGSIPDLKAVLQHYNGGGAGAAYQDPRIKPLGLTDQELESLEAFLNTLTDSYFIENEHFKKPK